MAWRNVSIYEEQPWEGIKHAKDAHHHNNGCKAFLLNWSFRNVAFAFSIALFSDVGLHQAWP